MLKNILDKVDTKQKLTKEDLFFLLSLEKKEYIEALFQKAYEVKLKYVGNRVFFRGLIELSNICEKDCYYCGIRKNNANVERFLMPKEQAFKSAMWAYESNYGSIVFQAGEVKNKNFIRFITELLSDINKATNGNLAVTLSLGEQSKETLQAWYNAGARRYLLRIESSNEKLYSKLHPKDHSFSERLLCLKHLREIGYQVGTGVMIGFPSQKIEDMVEDICFFKENDIDMIGMGPYIVHNDTPFAKEAANMDMSGNLLLALKMIAVTRCYLLDVNIASTTALQALKPDGREDGLKAGANIIMPNVTETEYRASYKLYENKPCIDENSQMCKGCLERKISGLGEEIVYGKWGNSPHYTKRISSV